MGLGGGGLRLYNGSVVFCTIAQKTTQGRLRRLLTGVGGSGPYKGLKRLSGKNGGRGAGGRLAGGKRFSLQKLDLSHKRSGAQRPTATISEWRQHQNTQFRFEFRRHTAKEYRS